MLPHLWPPRHIFVCVLKCTPFLRRKVNGCFHNTTAANFRKLGRRHLERRMYPRRIVGVNRAVDFRPIRLYVLGNRV
jgi:hypothetical protein